MPPSLHIAFLDGSPSNGGAQRSLAELAAALPPEFAITWIASRLPPELARRPGVTFQEFRCHTWSKTPLGLWHLWQDRQRFHRLWRQLRQSGQPLSILHVNGEPMMLLLPSRRETGIPVLLHVRDVRMPGFVRISACRRADSIVAISRFAAAGLPHAARPKTKIIYNGIGQAIDNNIFINQDQGSECLLLVADFVAWKRHALFLEMLAEIIKQDPHVHGVVIGRSRDASGTRLLAKLQRQAADLGLSKAVDFVTDCDDVSNYLRKSSVLVSTAEGEPFGRTILEALRQGKPVIAIANGGPAEILAGCQAGFLATHGNPEELAAMWFEYKKRASENGAALGTAAIHRANGFTIDRTAQAMLTLYQNLVEAPPRI